MKLGIKTIGVLALLSGCASEASLDIDGLESFNNIPGAYFADYSLSYENEVVVEGDHIVLASSELNETEISAILNLYYTHWQGGPLDCESTPARFAQAAEELSAFAKEGSAVAVLMPLIEDLDTGDWNTKARDGWYMYQGWTLSVAGSEGSVDEDREPKRSINGFVVSFHGNPMRELAESFNVQRCLLYQELVEAYEQLEEPEEEPPVADYMNFDAYYASRDIWYTGTGAMNLHRQGSRLKGVLMDIEGQALQEQEGVEKPDILIDEGSFVVYKQRIEAIAY